MMSSRTQQPVSKDAQLPLLMALVIGVAASAWIASIFFHDLLHGPHYPEYLAALPPQVRDAIRFCGTPPSTDGPGFVNWIAGWTLMTMAMMLPPALPLLRAFKRLTAGRTDAVRLITLVITAFLAVWILAGGALYLAGTLLNMLLVGTPVLAERPWLLAGLAAFLAGAYQFTPLKMACLDACRSPMSVIMTRWHAAHPGRASLSIGAAYGAICVGCCWALMLLSVVAGAMALPIMAAVAVIMMMERLLPSIRPLIPFQAGFAIAIGLLLIAGVVPAGFTIG
jgi:predicted metal-binding membrane protein